MNNSSVPCFVFFFFYFKEFILIQSNVLSVLKVESFGLLEMQILKVSWIKVYYK